MKKRIVKSLCSKALAAAVGAAVLMQAQAPVLAGALDTKLYISEVYLSYGETDEKAKQWLKDNGYTVLDQNLNESAEGGLNADWLSWTGLHSEKRSVYLGYKTTTNADEAIRDLRAMNMNGDFSYEDYEKMLENRKAEINGFIGNIKAALKEYRENYEAKKPKALIAHDNLNKYTDDDSGDAPLGDLLLKPIREEMSEEDYKKAEKEHADMTTIMMQGNLDIVHEIMTYLAYSADSSGTTWLERLKDTNTLDDLTEKYSEEYPTLSESKINNLLISMYDEDAKTFSDCLNEIKNAASYVDEIGLSFDASEETVTKYFEEHTDKSDISWASCANVIKAIEDVEYEGKKLVDFAKSEDLDLGDAEGRMALYPILDALSDGQRAMLNYTEFKDMIISGSLDKAGWEEVYKQVQETNKSSKACSVYIGIVRSAFEGGGVALTNEARNRQSSTGASYDAGLFGVDMSIAPIITGGVGVLFAIAGGVLWAKGSCMETVIASAKDAMDYISDRNVELHQRLLTMAQEVREKYNIPNSKDFNATIRFQNLCMVYEEIPEEMRKQIEVHLKDNKEFKTIMAEIDVHDNDYDRINQEIGSKFNEGVKEVRAVGDANRDVEFSINSTRRANIGKALCIAGIIIAIGSAAYAIYDRYQYYHQEMKPIPRIMVSESSDEKGRSKYTYYENVHCNRADQGFKNDKLGDNGDMNGDVGKQWLALYTTKDKAAGDPITADIIAQKGSNKAPADKTTGIRLFGKSDTVNIVSKEFGYNDALGGLYIFCGTEKDDAGEPEKTDTDSSETDASSEAAAPEESSAAAEDTSASSDTSSEAAAAEDTSSESENKAVGSVVGTGTMIASCGGSAVLGALICFLIARRKRNDTAA